MTSDQGFIRITVSWEELITQIISRIEAHGHSLTPGMAEALAAAFNKDGFEFLAALIRKIWPKISKADSEIDAQRLICLGKATFLYPLSQPGHERAISPSSTSASADAWLPGSN